MLSAWTKAINDKTFAETCQVLNFGKQKEPPVVRAALCTYLGVCLLHSHRCHPNRKWILNNKDRKKDDDNESEKICVHLALGISPDYRQKQESVKGQIQGQIQELGDY